MGSGWRVAMREKVAHFSPFTVLLPWPERSSGPFIEAISALARIKPILHLKKKKGYEVGVTV